MVKVVERNGIICCMEVRRARIGALIDLKTPACYLSIVI